MDEDPVQIIQGAVNLIKSAIEAFVPNNVGTGAMVFASSTSGFTSMERISTSITASPTAISPSTRC